MNTISISLPPLRDRRSDIPLLLDHFVKELGAQYQKDVRGFSRAARQALLSYDWPGNIRQLRNSVERMLVLDVDGLLDTDDLPEEVAALVRPEEDERPASDGAAGADTLIGRTLEEVEKYYMQRALEITNGKREEAANLLGIGERTLYRKIKEYNLRS